MNSTFRVCPKCGHKREKESEVPEYECPACGIIYEKYSKANSSKQVSRNKSKQKSKVNPQFQSGHSAKEASWISQRPSKVAVLALAVLLALLVVIWHGDQRSAMPYLASTSPGGITPPGVDNETVTQEAQESLAHAIQETNNRINALQSENEQYSGGLIKALIGSALAAERHTLAMLNQRQESWIRRIALNYTVDGKAYQVPEDNAGRLASIEEEIEAIRVKLRESKADADRYTGGLIRTTLLSAVATQKMSLAIMEQKRASLMFGFPLYVVNEASYGAPNAPASGSSEAREMDWVIVKIESRVTESNSSWHKYAWRLELKNNEDFPLKFRATIEFQDSDGFVIDEENEYGLFVPPLSSKTFTGSTLISVPGAFKVAKTNAKVGLK